MPMQWQVLPHLRTGARRRSVAQTRNSPSRTTLSSIARQPPWTLAGRQALCASTRSFGSSPSAGDCRERPSRGHSHSGRAKRACCSVSRARVRSRRAVQNGHLLDQLTFGTTYIWIILENVEGGPTIPQRWSACFSILPDQKPPSARVATVSALSRALRPALRYSETPPEPVPGGSKGRCAQNSSVECFLLLFIVMRAPHEERLGRPEFLATLGNGSKAKTIRRVSRAVLCLARPRALGLVGLP